MRMTLPPWLVTTVITTLGNVHATSIGGGPSCALSPSEAAGIRGMRSERNLSCWYNMKVESVLCV
jgi:hypothetical protein